MHMLGYGFLLGLFLPLVLEGAAHGFTGAGGIGDGLHGDTGGEAQAEFQRSQGSIDGLAVLVDAIADVPAHPCGLDDALFDAVGQSAQKAQSHVHLAVGILEQGMLPGIDAYAEARVRFILVEQFLQHADEARFTAPPAALDTDGDRCVRMLDEEAQGPGIILGLEAVAILCGNRLVCDAAFACHGMSPACGEVGRRGARDGGRSRFPGTGSLFTLGNRIRKKSRYVIADIPALLP